MVSDLASEMRVTSSWFQCPFHVSINLWPLFAIKRYSRLSIIFPCPSPRISHLSKETSSLWWRMDFRNQCPGTWYAHWFSDVSVSLICPLRGHNWEVDVYTCVPVYTFVCRSALLPSPLLSLTPFFPPFPCVCLSICLSVHIKPMSSHSCLQSNPTLPICNSHIPQCETSLWLSTVCVLICSILECTKLFENCNPCLRKKRTL